ncbi:MAG: hypothetical protein J0L93_07565 [Deltaproteobacteria bacterium]|nr:hypothetical protein [Deltaproteobacteria bacterium]
MIFDSEMICAFDLLEVKSNEVNKTIVSTAKAKAIECWKGGQTGTIYTIQWPGGSYKGRKVTVPSAPNLHSHQKVILYLWRGSPKDTFTITSWTQGVELIEWDAKLKEYILVEKNPSPVRPGKKVKKRTMASFGKKIEEIIKKGAPSKPR